MPYKTKTPIEAEFTEGNMGNAWSNPHDSIFYAPYNQHLHQSGVPMNPKPSYPKGKCHQGPRRKYLFKKRNKVFRVLLDPENGTRPLMVCTFRKDYAAEVSTVRGFAPGRPDVNGGEGGGYQILIPRDEEKELLTELRPASERDHELLSNPYDFNDPERLVYIEKL